jgi:EpsI family protein
VLVAAVVTVLVAALWPLVQRQIDQHTAQPVTQISPLGAIAGWHETREGLYDWSPRFENYAARTQVILENDGRLAGLFVAYYRNQDQQRKLVSSTNVLVTSNDPVWSRVGGGTREISLNQQPLKIRTTTLRGPGSTQMVVWQWYWISGRWTSSDVLAKAYTAFSRLIGRGDDSAVIILYARQTQPGEAEAILTAFADAAGEVIETALRQTADSR